MGEISSIRPLVFWSISPGGQWTFRVGNASGRGSFQNQAGGLLRKNGSPTSTITCDVPFTNEGVFQVSQGTINFTQSATQQGASSKTTLYGGSLSTSSVYTILGGKLEGIGTISGNVQNGDAMSGGTVWAGWDNLVGSLTITGTYTQSANGNTSILINAQGQYSTLNIGGQASLNGSLRVKNIGVFTTGTLNIITYASVVGDFASITYDTPTWYVNGMPYHFNANKQTTYYQLVVAAGEFVPPPPPPPP